ncbi:hypothetical protein JOB18_023376 [Solea senegalensis]|uniref:Uncharacterized protein n=1 Tax=Solea senegalensis TaxID=28829 RepID=A0AAV6S8B6_SOLSE|nr:hypothetical protein JOB18_023376 [Solea senegalensis]
MACCRTGLFVLALLFHTCRSIKTACEINFQTRANQKQLAKRHMGAQLLNGLVIMPTERIMSLDVDNNGYCCGFFTQCQHSGCACKKDFQTVYRYRQHQSGSAVLHQQYIFNYFKTEKGTGHDLNHSTASAKLGGYVVAPACVARPEYINVFTSADSSGGMKAEVTSRHFTSPKIFEYART